MRSRNRDSEKTNKKLRSHNQHPEPNSTNTNKRRAKVASKMTDNGTLRDHLADVIEERNDLYRKVQIMQAQIDELTRQLAALWKVDND